MKPLIPIGLSKEGIEISRSFRRYYRLEQVWAIDWACWGLPWEASTMRGCRDNRSAPSGWAIIVPLRWVSLGGAQCPALYCLEKDEDDPCRGLSGPSQQVHPIMRRRPKYASRPRSEPGQRVKAGGMGGNPSLRAFKPARVAPFSGLAPSVTLIDEGTI